MPKTVKITVRIVANLSDDWEGDLDAEAIEECIEGYSHHEITCHVEKVE
jgi:hypothetical protein